MSIAIGNKTVSNIQIGSKTVERIEIGGKTAYELPDYFCVTDASGSSNTLTLTKNGDAPSVSLEYSTDKVNWTTWTENNGVRTYTIPANGKVYLRGVNSNGFAPNFNDVDYYSFTCSKNYYIEGDMNTTVAKYGTDTLPAGCFNNFFKDSTTLKQASHLILSATVVGTNAYRQMFMGCTGLTVSPHELPQTDCVNTINSTGRCMTRMFSGCTSLTTMPIIRATRFGQQSCYEMFRGCSSLVNQWASADPDVSTTQNIGFVIDADNGFDQNFHGMFYGCTSLVNAGGISATKTTSWHTGVFHSMFYNCSKLTSAPHITIGSCADDSNTHCHSMFYGCSSLATVPNIKLDATTVYAASFKQMFYGCTSLTTAPEIKATSLATGSDVNNGSLAYMFQNCSKLASIKVHFTNWNSGNYTHSWTYGTKASGTFYKPSGLASTKNASGNTTNPNYIPYNWTVSNI